MNIPTCATQKCKRPLTKLGEPWNCYICLKCNKHPQEVNKLQKESEEKKRVYIDKKVTPEDVQNIVDAAVAKALAAIKPDYPAPSAVMHQFAVDDEEPEESIADVQKRVEQNLNKQKPETYLQKAKRLGVVTHIPTGGMRKKTEIMTDIEREETTEEANEFRKKAQTPPGDDDEFARGMTAEDMM